MKAFFAGSFDPFTIGHYSIVERALAIFEEGVTVAIGCNIAKIGSEGIAARLRQVREAVKPLGPKVEVITYEGLTVDAMARAGAGCLLRGVRSVADYEYERNIADINRRIAGVETVVMFALPDMAMVSSSMVRELRHYGRDVSEFIPPTPADNNQ